MGLQGKYTVVVDDTIIIYSDITKEGMESKINANINFLDNRLRMNILTLYTGKTHCMISHLKKSKAKP